LSELCSPSTINCFGWFRGKQKERRCRAQGFRPKLCRAKSGREKVVNAPASVHLIREEAEVGFATARHVKVFRVNHKERRKEEWLDKTLSLSCSFGCGAIRGEALEGGVFRQVERLADSTF
jgi:hypothetical protein